jgi:sodium pump decarboxylase gamma subunit
MTENMTLALEITLLGMGLVFLAIILLWLLMWVLTALPLKDAEESQDGNNVQTAPTENNDLEAQAAAIAVAIALAEQSQSSARPLSLPPTALVSAWQLGMRTRQMYEKGGR